MTSSSIFVVTWIQYENACCKICPTFSQHSLNILSVCVVMFIDSRDLHIQLAIECILNSNYALPLSLSLFLSI